MPRTTTIWPSASSSVAALFALSACATSGSNSDSTAHWMAVAASDEPTASVSATADGDAGITEGDPTTEAASFNHTHLSLGTDESGVCVGNSKRWHGIRLNFADAGVEEVRGLNIGVWDRNESSIDRMSGIDIGLKNQVGEGRGISLGVVGTVAHESLSGIALGGLGAVSEGDLHGLGVGGLAVVAMDELKGIHLGGLAVVSGGRQSGLGIGGAAVVSQGAQKGIHMGGIAVVSQGAQRGASVAGLAVVSQGEQRGIKLAGLAVISEGSQWGVSAAGLACVSGEDFTGISVGGLASVANGDSRGVTIGGLTNTFGGHFEGIGVGGLIVGDHRAGDFDFSLGGPPNLECNTTAKGLMLAGYRVQANEIQGIAGALLMTRSHNMSGIAVSAFNAISGKQTGLSVGLFNHAAEIDGIQIGLLNYVAANPKWLRWLPIFNAHF